MATASVNIKRGNHLVRYGEDLAIPYEDMEQGDFSTNLNGSGYSLFWDGMDHLYMGNTGINTQILTYNIPANKWNKLPFANSENWSTSSPGRCFYWDEINKTLNYSSNTKHYQHDLKNYSFNNPLTSSSTVQPYDHQQYIDLNGNRSTTGSYLGKLWRFDDTGGFDYYDKALGTWTALASSSFSASVWEMAHWLPGINPDKFYLTSRATSSALSDKGFNLYEYDIAQGVAGAGASAYTTLRENIPYLPFYGTNVPNIAYWFFVRTDTKIYFIDTRPGTTRSGVSIKIPVFEIDVQKLIDGDTDNASQVLSIDRFEGGGGAYWDKSYNGSLSIPAQTVKINGVWYLYFYQVYVNDSSDPNKYKASFKRFILPQ